MVAQVAKHTLLNGGASPERASRAQVIDSLAWCEELRTTASWIPGCAGHLVSDGEDAQPVIINSIVSSRELGVGHLEHSVVVGFDLEKREPVIDVSVADEEVEPDPGAA